jgi:phosphoribosylformylglycinamidine cyclo-ligase
MGLTYRESGVDISKQDEAIARLKPHAERTFNQQVLTGIGAFAGQFKPDLTGVEEPVLVSSTDGVGTKLKYAFRFNRHNTVGIDLVATCINDVITCGAKPLFFLDYIGCHTIEPEVIESLVEGMSKGCEMSECALVGGEIAEMRDMYGAGEYDIVGFAVGLVDRKKAIDGRRAEPGDAIIGLDSSGIHSNGYSLVRKVFERYSDEEYRKHNSEIGTSLMDEVLKPTRIYWNAVKAVLARVDVKAMAHISGGGLVDNVPRVLPKGVHARIDASLLAIPPVFSIIKRLGRIAEHEMIKTFNMGVGYVLVAAERDVPTIVDLCREAGYEGRTIGQIVEGTGPVELVA